jgi:hypothetical protein
MAPSGFSVDALKRGVGAVYRGWAGTHPEPAYGHHRTEVRPRTLSQGWV